MYMDYCKFRMTWKELEACLEDVEAHIAEEARYGVSEEEIMEFEHMMWEIFQFLERNELIKHDGIDMDRLEEIEEKMRQENENVEDDPYLYG